MGNAAAGSIRRKSPNHPSRENCRGGADEHREKKPTPAWPRAQRTKASRSRSALASTSRNAPLIRPVPAPTTSESSPTANRSRVLCRSFTVRGAESWPSICPGSCIVAPDCSRAAWKELRQYQNPLIRHSRRGDRGTALGLVRKQAKRARRPLPFHGERVGARGRGMFFNRAGICNRRLATSPLGGSIPTGLERGEDEPKTRQATDGGIAGPAIKASS